MLTLMILIGIAYLPFLQDKGWVIIIVALLADCIMHIVASMKGKDDE